MLVAALARQRRGGLRGARAQLLADAFADLEAPARSRSPTRKDEPSAIHTIQLDRRARTRRRRSDNLHQPTGAGAVRSADRAASPPPASVVTPEEEALFGPRVGLLLKQLGKVAQWVGPDDRDYSTWGVRMVVHKIEIDPKCDRYVDEPDRGHRLVLRAETSELYNSSRDGIPQYYEWSTIGPDSVSEALPSSLTCRSAAAFPDELRSSAKDCGNVTVETANPVGRLVFADLAVYDSPVGP